MSRRPTRTVKLVRLRQEPSASAPTRAFGFEDGERADGWAQSFVHPDHVPYFLGEAALAEITPVADGARLRWRVVRIIEVLPPT